jgi:hypothetical protein
MDPVASKVKELTNSVRPNVKLDIVMDAAEATLPVVVAVKLQDDARYVPGPALKLIVAVAVIWSAPEKTFNPGKLLPMNKNGLPW